MSGKVGRPTKYKPEFCEKVMDMGREGYGVAEIAAELDVTKQTVHNWQKEHPAFLDAMTRARDLSEGWWASQGRQGIWGKENRRFNSNAYRLQMMNRFGWGEKSSREHTVTGREMAKQIEEARLEMEDSVSGDDE